jgi:3',5'-cyclic AMP phosphodiesterase CpdA
VRRAIALLLLLVGAGTWLPAAQEIPLLGEADSLKFAVIGDNGTGERPQYEVGAQMAAARATFPFEMVLMAGDNMYGRQEPQDFVTKFERPYALLLGAGVPFYATLGNHDQQTNRTYKGFNMNGERYYTFARQHVRFYVFDTNMLDPKQREWIEQTLAEPHDGWKICLFHHPLYSDAGRHGSNVELRVALEPVLVRYGVTVAFTGHDHVYERVQPQKGITYFVVGSSGQLRKGDLVRSPTMAAGFDQDQAFMLVEIAGNVMRFQTISRTGRVVDSGVIGRRPQT